MRLSIRLLSLSLYTSLRLTAITTPDWRTARREAAIVTEIPGTTRDVLELSLDFHGYPIVVADTAGLRTTTRDRVETIGIERAVER